jgi:hypothetical protein
MNMALNGFTERDTLIIAGMRAEVRLEMEDFPLLDYFENLTKNCKDAIFFEALASCVKNSVLAYQAYFYRVKNARHLRLTNRITELKHSFTENLNAILEVERELSNIEENERKTELEHFKTFSILNAERITPHFMSLVKNTKADSSTNEIRKDNGEAFVAT